jgi:hypothetical protein
MAKPKTLPFTMTVDVPAVLFKSLEARAKRRRVTPRNLASDFLFQALAIPTCRICGCTEFDACGGDETEPCHWVGPDLCSACAPVAAALRGKRRAVNSGT